MQEVARHAGVSRPAVWRWQTRYAEHGVEGLLRDKTRKPGRAPLSAKIVAKVIDLTCSERPALISVYPRFPRAGRKRFPIWRNPDPEDFDFVADTEAELEGLPALCAGLSRILWWKNITAADGRCSRDGLHGGGHNSVVRRLVLSAPPIFIMAILRQARFLLCVGGGAGRARAATPQGTVRTRQQASTSSRRRLATRPSTEAVNPKPLSICPWFQDRPGPARSLNTRGMRPSPSSPLGPTSEAPDRSRGHSARGAVLNWERLRGSHLVDILWSALLQPTGQSDRRAAPSLAVGWDPGSRDHRRIDPKRNSNS